ncbi:MAG: toxin-antitoxin system HicB family antitoxin [Oligoflexia bacterium]|nr:toxin-antitoxin system HicB family antitoxin [Oligoflexia bacterium]
MKYNFDKYTYRVTWSEEDNEFVGLCLEFPSLSALAKTPDGALKEIRFVVKECILSLIKEKASVPEPIAIKRFKGNLTLRVPPEIHRKLAISAAEAGVSLNQYILSKIAA